MITIGQQMNVIMLDRPEGKPTGETRPVRVEQILYHLHPKNAIRSVLVLTIDDLPQRREWVSPRYLLPIQEMAAA